MRAMVERADLQHMIELDSAGTHSYHEGAPPDARSQAAAKARGYDLSQLRARRVLTTDFDEFDLLLAMDHDNLELLRRLCPTNLQGKLKLMMYYAVRHSVPEVPDPYYAGTEGFELVLDYLEDACKGLLNSLTTMP